MSSYSSSVYDPVVNSHAQQVQISRAAAERYAVLSAVAARRAAVRRARQARSASPVPVPRYAR